MWSDEIPYLYECHIKLVDGGKVIDEVIETFGIRTISYNSKGFFINGKETLLRGGCVHHDNGILGAKSYKKSEWRRVKKLKEAGFNAIRSAHNPCSVYMLEACDYYGVYLIDETWDMWYMSKNEYDYANHFVANYKLDMESMVKKDFNHPSVIMYSIGNEVSEPAHERGIELAKDMVTYLHRLDESRPVTGGFNLMIIQQEAAGKGVYSSKDKGKKDNPADKIFAEKNSSLAFNMATAAIWFRYEHVFKIKRS